MKSEFFKEMNGKWNISSITGKELILDKDGFRIYYKKVDRDEITRSNSQSGLLGAWEFSNEPYQDMTTILTFKEADEFTIIEKEEGHSAKLSGTWIFDPKEKSLIMIGLRGEDIFDGENKVLRIEEDRIEIENKGHVFKAERKAMNSQAIEHLTFSDADFFNEDGDYLYDDEEEKLPWRNWPEMKMNLLNVKQLVYNYSTVISGTEVFESKILTADVNASLEEEGFTIDNIFKGFDRYKFPEDADMPQDGYYSNPTYPLDLYGFRVVGNEQITVPAGTFDCIVLEAIDEYGLLKKLWMINDKIGTYAKIVEEDPDESFGYYSGYELKEIRTGE